MNTERIYDMLVIGGGPAGYTAALYGTRAGFDTLVLEKLSAGGQMALTHQIDNYPGFDEGIDGFELAEKMQRQAERFGAKTEYAEVQKLDLTAEPKKVETSEGIFYGKTVVFAAGAAPRKLGIEKEDELIGRGVAYCAACDGMFFKGKTVAVVGGGNSAAADAMILSRIAKKVLLIHRRDTLRATKIYHEPLMAAENIEFHWNSEVYQRRKDTFHRIGGRAAAFGSGRIYSGGRNDRDKHSRRLCCGRRKDKTPSPDNFGSGRWSCGSSHGRRASGRSRVGYMQQRIPGSLSGSRMI